MAVKNSHLSALSTKADLVCVCVCVYLTDNLLITQKKLTVTILNSISNIWVVS